MKAALPYWHDRISPVLDTANNFLVVDIEDNNRVGSLRMNLAGKSLPERVRLLKDQGVALLLCGAISEHWRCIFVSNGIEVIPWLRGDVDYIIEAFINDSLREPEFMMPGHHSCCRRRRCRRGKKLKG